MKKISTVILFGVIALLLTTGCGGGSTDSTIANQQSNDLTFSLSDEYDGKKVQAKLSTSNYIKFIHAVHYIENLDWENIPTSENQDPTIIKTNNIDQNTGLGYEEYEYLHYQYKDNQRINGSLRVDITDIQESDSVTTIYSSISLDITTSTDDNNITFKLQGTSTVKLTNYDEETLVEINKYHIYDQQSDEIIELFFDEQTHVGRLYLSSEGYVESISDDMLFHGASSTTLNLNFKEEEPIYATQYRDPVDPINGSPEPYQHIIYRPKNNQGVIESTLNNSKMSDLYFVDLKVSTYEPPKFKLVSNEFEEFYNEVKLIEYSFYSWATNYKLLNDNTSNISVETEWYINDQKIETQIQEELPLNSYNEGDTIKVVIQAKHGDIVVTEKKVLEGYATNYRASSGTYEYPDDTFDLEIPYSSTNHSIALNLLKHEYFNQVDIENSIFSWKVFNPYFLEIEAFSITDDTRYQQIPQITFTDSTYGSIYLKVYSNHEVKVARFDILLTEDSQY